MVRSASETDIGTKHEVNEDRHAISTTRGGGALLLLCDGMGGMGSGDQAAQTAIDLMAKWASNDEAAQPLETVRAAIQHADRAVMQSFEPKDGRKPGTTCACVVLRDGLAYVCWVGDSSILVIRDGRVFKRSRPHRMVQDLIDAGSMTPDEAKRSPMRHFLTRSLGGREEGEPVEPEALSPVPLRLGDRIVLCSDGLTDFVAPDEIAAVVQRQADPATAARDLVSLALERQVDDNVSVIVAQVDDPGSAPATHVVGDEWELGDVPFDLDDDYGSDIRERRGAVVPRDEAPPDEAATTWLLAAIGGVALLIVVCLAVLVGLLLV